MTRITVLKGLIATVALGLVSQVHGELSVEEWQMLDTELDFAFVSEDAPYVENQEVFIDPVNVWYPSAVGDAETIQKLQDETIEALTAALVKAGYSVLETPKSDGLRLHVELIDLKLHPLPDGKNPWEDRFMFDVAPGHMTVVAELRDMKTDAVLLRIADKEKDLDTALEPWAQAQQQLSHWSEAIAGNMTPITEGNWLQVAKK